MVVLCPLWAAEGRASGAAVEPVREQHWLTNESSREMLSRHVEAILESKYGEYLKRYKNHPEPFTEKLVDFKTWRNRVATTYTYVLAMRAVTVEALLLERLRLIEWWEYLNRHAAPRDKRYPPDLRLEMERAFSVAHFPRLYQQRVEPLANGRSEALQELENASKPVNSHKHLEKIIRSSFLAWEQDRKLYELQIEKKAFLLDSPDYPWSGSFPFENLEEARREIPWAGACQRVETQSFGGGYTTCGRKLRAILESAEYKKVSGRIDDEVMRIKLTKDLFLNDKRFLLTGVPQSRWHEPEPNRRYLSLTRFEANQDGNIHLDQMDHKYPDIPLYQMIVHFTLNDLHKNPTIPASVWRSFPSYHEEVVRHLYSFDVDTVPVERLSDTAIRNIQLTLLWGIDNALDANEAVLRDLVQLDEAGYAQKLTGSTRYGHFEKEPENIEGSILKFSDLIPMFLKSPVLLDYMCAKFDLPDPTKNGDAKELVKLWEKRQSQLNTRENRRAIFSVFIAVGSIAAWKFGGPLIVRTANALLFLSSIVVGLESIYETRSRRQLIEALYKHTGQNIFALTSGELAESIAMEEEAYRSMLSFVSFLGIASIGSTGFNLYEKATRVTAGGRIWLRTADIFDIKSRIKVVTPLLEGKTIDKKALFELLAERLQKKASLIGRALSASSKEVGSGAIQVSRSKAFGDEFAEQWSVLRRTISEGDEVEIVARYSEVAAWLRGQSAEFEIAAASAITVANITAAEGLLLKLVNKEIDPQSALVLIEEAQRLVYRLRYKMRAALRGVDNGGGGKIVVPEELSQLDRYDETLWMLRSKFEDLRFNNAASPTVQKYANFLKRWMPKKWSAALKRESELVALNEIKNTPLGKNMIEGLRRFLAWDYAEIAKFDRWLFQITSERSLLVPYGYARRVAQNMTANVLSTAFGDRLLRLDLKKGDRTAGEYLWANLKSIAFEDWGKTAINFSNSTISAFVNPYFSMGSMTLFRKQIGIAQVGLPAAMASVSLKSLVTGEIMDVDCLPAMARHALVAPNYYYVVSGRRREFVENLMRAFETLGSAKGLKTSAIVVGLNTVDTAAVGRALWVTIGDYGLGASGSCKGEKPIWTRSDLFDGINLYRPDDPDGTFPPLSPTPEGAKALVFSWVPSYDEREPEDLEEVFPQEEIFEFDQEATLN